MTRHILFTHEKGGSGTTTTATNLAWLLAENGRRTLLVDIDSNGNCAISLGLEPAPGLSSYLLDDGEGVDPYVLKTAQRHLDLLPCNAIVQAIHAGHAAEVNSLSVMGAGLAAKAQHNVIKRVATQLYAIEGYDVICYDAKANGAYIRQAALFLANLLVVPTRLETLGLADIPRILDQYDQVKPGAPYLIVPTVYDCRKNVEKHTLAALREAYGHRVTEPVPNSVAIQDASNSRCVVVAADPQSRPAIVYRQIERRIAEALYV